MKRNLSLPALLAVFAISSCQKDMLTTTERNTSATGLSAAKTSAGAGGNTTINLSVTVDNASGNQILSDGKGAYVNGTDRVDAQILSSDGNFYMNTNNNTVKLSIRTMSFLPGNPELGLAEERNYSLRTNASIRLQDMAVNSSQNVGFRVWGVLQSGVVDWRLLFRNGLEASPSSLTDSAKVTRLPNDVWTIEPAGVPGIIFANARLVNGLDTSKGLGYYQVPFKLTLTRITR